MTSSASSTPDIGSLSLSSKPSMQRFHDSHDYEVNDGDGGARSQYHYSTSPPIPAQSQYSPLTLGQSPLKNKTLRGGLPSVRFFTVFSLPNHCLTERRSNGWTIPSPPPITGRSLLTTTPTFLPPEVPPQRPRSTPPPLRSKGTRMRSSLRLSSSRISPSTSKEKPSWTSSSACFTSLLFCVYLTSNAGFLVHPDSLRVQLSP